jgi:paraquat-inducible protein B
MAEGKAPPALSNVPDAVVQPPRRSRVSIVWLVPIVALVIGAWLAWHALAQRGPTITILFFDSEGIEAGKTKIKYKNVDVGTVAAVQLTSDRKLVRVTAHLQPETSDWLVKDTRFWVVRPRVGAGGISGLGTLLSGAYIGMDVGKSTEDEREFTGLAIPPVLTDGVPGRQFTLLTDVLGSLDRGTLVFFRRIPVGQVIAYQLTPGGNGVQVQVFVEAPYDQYVTRNARFWHASGIDVDLSASGLSVRTESLASIIGGGIAFQSAPDAPPSPPADAGATFKLFDSRNEAIAPDTGRIERYVLYFSESVRGLLPGAPVEFRGIPFGQVRHVGAEYDFDRKRFRIRVEIDIYPERLASTRRGGAERRTLPTDRKASMDLLFAEGLRAQLRTGNLITGQMYVAFDMFPKSAKVGVDWSADPPEVPTVPAALTELQESVAGVVKKIDQIPFDRIAADVETALKSLDATLKRVEQVAANVDRDVTPELRATLDQAKRAMVAAEKTANAAQGTVSGDSALAIELRESIRELTRTMQSVRSLTEYLERHPEALLRGKRPEESR